MGSRDREQRDQQQERIDVLTRALDSAMTYGLAACDALRSDCVERRIREEHLARKLREAEQKIERLQKVVNDALNAAGIQTRPLPARMGRQ